MHKHVYALLFCLAAVSVGAEGPPKAKQLGELNRQMWMPFLEGIRSDRAELYVGVHSSAFHWVAPGSHGRIMNLREYEEDSIAVMKRRRAAGERTELDIRFLERNVSGDFAVEKCVIRFVLHRGDRAAEPAYGIAHYFSRKENGVWKMWLQHGSTEKATAAMFEAAAPLEDVDRFVAAAKPADQRPDK